MHCLWFLQEDLILGSLQEVRRIGEEEVRKMSVSRLGLLPWLHAKIVDPLMQIIKRGAEPKQLAFSAALGVTLGIFPICGTTVFLCGFAIAMCGDRCHAPTLMLINLIVTPVELSLIIPFLRLGEAISGGQHFSLTSDAFKKLITGKASMDVLFSILHAMLGWLLAAPFVLVILYIIFTPCFKLLIHKFSSIPVSPKRLVSAQTEVKLKVRDV